MKRIWMNGSVCWLVTSLRVQFLSITPQMKRIWINGSVCWLVTWLLLPTPDQNQGAHLPTVAGRTHDSYILWGGWVDVAVCTPFGGETYGAGFFSRFAFRFCSMFVKIYLRQCPKRNHETLQPRRGAGRFPAPRQSPRERLRETAKERLKERG